MNYKRIRPILIILPVMFLLTACPTSEETEPEPLATWNVYTTSSGLISNDIQCVAVDNIGNLWFGTSYGVSKYNKISWTPYNTNKGLIYHEVRGIAADVNNNIWMVTRLGASRLSGNVFTNYDSSAIANTDATGVVVDANNTVFITTMGGVAEFKNSAWTMHTKQGGDGLVHNRVKAAAIDKQNNKWFGTEWGASRYTGNGWKNFIQEISSTPYITTIFVSEAGWVYMGTFNGVSYYDGSTWRKINTTNLVHPEITAITEDKEGNMWFGTPFGLTMYDGQNFTQYAYFEGTTFNYVTGLAVDNEDHIWIGTRGGGVVELIKPSSTKNTD